FALRSGSTARTVGYSPGPCPRTPRSARSTTSAISERTGFQPGPRRETCGPADGGAERMDGATHFVAPTSACRGSTFTGTGRARCMEMLRFLKFRQRSTPPLDFRFFVLSSYLTRTNIRESSHVLTVLNHFHTLSLRSTCSIRGGSAQEPLTS